MPQASLPLTPTAQRSKHCSGPAPSCAVPKLYQESPLTSGREHIVRPATTVPAMLGPGLPRAADYTIAGVRGQVLIFVHLESDRLKLTVTPIAAVGRRASAGLQPDLLDLKQIKAAFAVQAQTHGGIRSVPINQPRGSEGRSRYFDRDFNPLHDQAQGRWLNIARARQQGRDLPPVVLVQVGEFTLQRMDTTASPWLGRWGRAISRPG